MLRLIGLFACACAAIVGGSASAQQACVDLAKVIARDISYDRIQVARASQAIENFCDLDKSNSDHTESFKAGGAVYMKGEGSASSNKEDYEAQLHFLCLKNASAEDTKQFVDHFRNSPASVAMGVIDNCFRANAANLETHITQPDDNHILISMKNETPSPVHADRILFDKNGDFSCAPVRPMDLNPNVNYSIRCDRRDYRQAEKFGNRLIKGKYTFFSVRTDLADVTAIAPQIDWPPIQQPAVGWTKEVGLTNQNCQQEAFLPNGQKTTEYQWTGSEADISVRTADTPMLRALLICTFELPAPANTIFVDYGGASMSITHAKNQSAPSQGGSLYIDIYGGKPAFDPSKWNSRGDVAANIVDFTAYIATRENQNTWHQSGGSRIITFIKAVNSISVVYALTDSWSDTS